MQYNIMIIQKNLQISNTQTR